MQGKKNEVAREPMIPDLMGEHAQQVLGFRVIRVFMQSLLICCIGLLQSAGLVVLESLLNQKISCGGGHCYGAAVRSVALMLFSSERIEPPAS